jgi:AraC-like DNA-binding protein
MHFFKFYLLLLFLPALSFATTKDSLAIFKEKNLQAQYSYLKEHLNTSQDIEPYIIAFLEQASQQKDTNYIAQSYYFKHRFHRKFKAYAKAHKAIDTAILFAIKPQNDSLLGSFFHAKGATFYIQSNYKDALTYYLKAYDIMRTKGIIENRLTLEFDIATIKLKVGQTKEALRNFDRILYAFDSLVKVTPDSQFLKIRLIKMLNNTAKSYTDAGLYEKANEFYSKSLLLNETTNYLSGKCIAIGGKANVFTAEKKYEKALIALEQALAISTNHEELHLITPFLLLDKGKCLFGLKQYQEALKNFEDTAQIIRARKLQFIGLDETYMFLAKTQVQLGNHEEATKIYDEYIERKNLSTDKRFELYKTIFEGYDLKNVEQQAEKATQESYLFKSYFTQAIVAIVLLLVITISVFIAFRKKQQQKLAKFHTIIDNLKVKKSTQDKNPSKAYVVPDEKAKKILNDLSKLEAKLFFLDKKYNLSTLAKKCHTNSSYLSQVINKYKGKTFSEYMTDMRINYVLNALKNNRKLRSYTIQSIAEEIGFKKSESFAKAFKKRTGLNPSFYIKNLDSM